MRGRNLRYALAAMVVAGVVALVVLGVSRPPSAGPAAATTATATATATATPTPTEVAIPIVLPTPVPILTLGQTVGAGTYRIVGSDEPGFVFTVPAGGRITFDRIELNTCLWPCGGDSIVLTNSVNDTEWLCVLSISLEECGRNVSSEQGDGITDGQSGSSTGTGALFDAIVTSMRQGP